MSVRINSRPHRGLERNEKMSIHLSMDSALEEAINECPEMSYFADAGSYGRCRNMRPTNFYMRASREANNFGVTII